MATLQKLAATDAFLFLMGLRLWSYLYAHLGGREGNEEMSDCRCGHAKKDHIYEEGSCRPGFVCEWRCDKYIAETGDACIHVKTKMWEPHLAGARKCLDCERVYNPNCTPNWFFEGPTDQERIEVLREESAKLHAIVLVQHKALQNIQNEAIGGFDLSPTKFNKRVTGVSLKEANKALAAVAEIANKK